MSFLQHVLPGRVGRASRLVSATIRTLRTSSVRLAVEDKMKPSYGPGAIAGTMPTDIEQATGPERYELLNRLKGRQPFYDEMPLVITRRGTRTKPHVIRSLSNIRQIGCTGHPGEEHEILWLKVESGRDVMCQECGNWYSLKIVSPEEFEQSGSILASE